MYSSHSRTSSTSSTSTGSTCSNKSFSPTSKPMANGMHVESSLHHTNYVNRENEKNRLNGSNYNASTLPRLHQKSSDNLAGNGWSVGGADQIDNKTNKENDHSESLYGTIRPHAKAQPNDVFTYKTLNGSVIRSVHPPGKGIATNYKVFLKLIVCFIYMFHCVFFVHDLKYMFVQ